MCSLKGSHVAGVIMGPKHVRRIFYVTNVLYTAFLDVFKLLLRSTASFIDN